MRWWHLRWVKGNPEEEGEACLVIRNIGQRRWTNLSRSAYDLVTLVLDETFPHRRRKSPALWNDRECPDFGTVMAVLDEAIRMAKENEHNHD